MRRRSFIQSVFGGVAAVLLWPGRKLAAWRARILVNGRPLPNSMVQVGENRWHGKIDAGQVGPGDHIAIEFQRDSAAQSVSISIAY